MYQIDNATAATSQPASTPVGTAGFFTDGNPATSVPATIVPAEWLNAVMMELVNVVTAGGLTPSKSSFNQVLTAIKAIGKQRVTLTDTGVANAYAASNSPALVAGTWVDGVVQFVKIANANTGASTYAADGLAAIPILGSALLPLQGGELKAGGIAALMRATIAGVNSGNPICVLLFCSGGAVQVAASSKSAHSVTQGQAFGVNAAYNAPGRVVGTTYTNSTGRPIAVYVYGVTSSPNGYVAMAINGVQTLVTSQPANASGVGFMAIIPPGATYAVSVQTVTLTIWNEFA